MEEQKEAGSRRCGRKRGRLWMNKSREIRELGGMDVRVLDHSKSELKADCDKSRTPES